MPTPPVPKIVFVIGAGASKEVKLPIGSELKKLVAKTLDIQVNEFQILTSGDRTIYEAFCIASSEPSRKMYQFLDASRRIRDAMPQASSIDQFIDDHRGDKCIELCGKLAIGRTILNAEAQSSLFVDQTKGVCQLKHHQLEDTWFNSFRQLFTSHLADLRRLLSSVALIVFNYDRCIEHYLYYALQNYYSIRAEEAASLLQHLEIYHPYGSVGALPWQNTAPEFKIEFGATPRARDLIDLTSKIKTFTEGTDESSSNILAIRSTIAAAKKIVFLGFSFNPMNLDLLRPPSLPGPLPDRPVYATAYQLSVSHRESIPAALLTRHIVGKEKHVELRDLTCAKLFHEFGWALHL